MTLSSRNNVGLAVEWPQSDHVGTYRTALNAPGYWHNWTCKQWGGPSGHVPLVYSLDSLQELLDNVAANYSGYLLCFNEPLVAGQANMTSNDVGEYMAWINGQRPSAKLIGPQMSELWWTDSDNYDFVKDALTIYEAKGGDLSQWLSFGVHFYRYGTSPMNVSSVYSTIYGSCVNGTHLANRVAWVTELGVANDGNSTKAQAQQFFEDVFSHVKTSVVFGYTPYLASPADIRMNLVTTHGGSTLTSICGQALYDADIW